MGKNVNRYTAYISRNKRRNSNKDIEEQLAKVIKTADKYLLSTEKKGLPENL